MEVNAYETLKIEINNSNGGYSSYLLFANHNGSHTRSFSGFVFGDSLPSHISLNVYYNELINNPLVEIKEGKYLQIVNKSPSQFMLHILKLSNDNSFLKISIVK